MVKTDISIRIDSHVHIMPPRRLQGLVRWMHKINHNHPVPESITKEALVEDLKKNGITHFFNLVYPLTPEETDTLNEFNIDFCKKTPGAIPFASMHQDTPHKVKLAEKIFSNHPVLGFKFQPSIQGFEPWDNRLDPLYEFLQDVKKPVLLHTGFGSTTAEQLEGLLKRFPRLPIVFAHMGFPEIEKIYHMMDNYSELYLEATLVLPFQRTSHRQLLSSIPGGKKGLELLIDGLNKYKDRIMYGSDYPVGMGHLHDIYNDLEMTPVPDSVKQNIRSTTPMAFVDRFLPDFNWNQSLQDL